MSQPCRPLVEVLAEIPAVRGKRGAAVLALACAAMLTAVTVRARSGAAPTAPRFLRR
jgi:hypothetical protein